MARFYHGSRPRYLIDGLGYGVRQAVKGLRAAVASIGMRRRDRVRYDLVRTYRRGVAARAWAQATIAAEALAAHASATGDAALMTEMAGALQRLSRFDAAADLALAARRLRKPRSEQEWTGEAIGAGTLILDLTESARQSIGSVVRHAQLLGAAARRTSRCMALVEPRLVPIVRRSFPQLAAVASAARELPPPDCGVRVLAYPEHLAAALARTAEAIRSHVDPLKPDPELRSRLRARYLQQAPGPLIGLSWGSRSHSKDVPSFPDWNRFIAQTRGTFVSLQYGEIRGALARLRAGHPDRLLYVDGIDHLQDMEVYAAQVAAWERIDG
jgi:hypothetical protein